MAEWYCRLMGTEMGPYTALQLQDLARMHRLSPEDLIKKGLAGEWVPAFRVRGLFEESSPSRPGGVSPTSSSPASGPGSSGRAGLPPAPEGSQAGRTLRQDAKSPSVTPPMRETRPIIGAASASADRADWYCLCRGERVGPLAFAELERMANSGELKGTDRVWRASSPKWHPACEIGGLPF